MRSRYRIKHAYLAWRPSFRSSSALFPALAHWSRWFPLAAVVWGFPWSPPPWGCFPFYGAAWGHVYPHLSVELQHPHQLRDNQGPRLDRQHTWCPSLASLGTLSLYYYEVAAAVVLFHIHSSVYTREEPQAIACWSPDHSCLIRSPNRASQALSVSNQNKWS